MERRDFFAFLAITLQRQVPGIGMMMPLVSGSGSPCLPLSKFERPGSPIGDDY
jgi:hypothetical protein